MPDEPEEGFTIRDRRRFNADSEEAPARETAPVENAAATAPAAAAEPVAASQAFEPAQEDFSPLGGEFEGVGELNDAQLPDIYSVLALFLGELRNLAWLRMGLLANPATGQVERDLPQAKIAIDTVAFLASQLEPVIAPEERLPLKALVSDLQVNFVEQSKRG